MVRKAISSRAKTLSQVTGKSIVDIKTLISESNSTKDIVLKLSHDKLSDPKELELAGQE